MKKTILALVCLISGLAARAAEPVVTLADLQHVTINGAPAGTIVDAIANHANSPVRAKLLDLLLAREKTAAEAAAKREEALQEKIGVLNVGRQDAERRLSEFVAKIKASSAEAVQAEDDRQRKALEAQQAELAARLAAMKKAP